MKLFFLLSFLIVNTASAEIKITGDEDVLSNVESKLSQIEARLKDQRLFVAPAVFKWTELSDFREEIMFAVAHDPSGPVLKDTPEQLTPTHLTQKLKLSFEKLEESVYQISTLVKSAEWISFKADVELFLKHREEFLYVPARQMIRSGELTSKFDRLKETASNMLKLSEKSQHISVRVIDPVIEELSGELHSMNIAVRQLQDFRKPRPVEITTIFQEKNQKELGMLAGAVFLVTVMLSLMVQWIASKFKKPVSLPEVVQPKNLNYSDWLNRLENNLKSFKTHEDKMTEDQIKLKNSAHALSESRKKLNQTDNQQEFYESLEQLNASAMQIEGYFESLNVKKNSDVSRRVISQVVQLCDALESNQEINFSVKVDPEVVELRIA